VSSKFMQSLPFSRKESSLASPPKGRIYLAGVGLDDVTVRNLAKIINAAGTYTALTAWTMMGFCL
jgi:hypothetical protein